MFFIAGIQYPSNVYSSNWHSITRSLLTDEQPYRHIESNFFLVHFRFDGSQPGLMFMWEYGDSEEMCVNCHHHTGFKQSLHLFWIIAERVPYVIVKFVMFVCTKQHLHQAWASHPWSTLPADEPNSENVLLQWCNKLLVETGHTLGRGCGRGRARDHEQID